MALGIGAGMALGGAASAGGSLLGSTMSAGASKDAAKRMIKAQLYMSNTAHQREVEDLRAAGLNPILSATGGRGASTEIGAMPRIPDYGQALSAGLNSAVSFMTAKQNLKSQSLDLRAKEGMYAWLDKNPHFKEMFNAGLLASTAGLPTSIFGPIFGLTSASMLDSLEKMRHDAANPRSTNVEIGEAPILDRLFRDAKKVR